MATACFQLFSLYGLSLSSLSLTFLSRNETTWLCLTFLCSHLFWVCSPLLLYLSSFLLLFPAITQEPFLKKIIKYPILTGFCHILPCCFFMSPFLYPTPNKSCRWVYANPHSHALPPRACCDQGRQLYIHAQELLGAVSSMLGSSKAPYCSGHMLGHHLPPREYLISTAFNPCLAGCL